MIGAPTGGFQPDKGFTGELLNQQQGRPHTGGLGMGLGLNRFQRGRFLQAAQSGGGEDYLASHPGLQQRIQNRIEPGSPEESRLQQYMAGGNPLNREVRYGPGRGQPAPEAAAPDINRGMTPEESGAGTMDRTAGAIAGQLGGAGTTDRGAQLAEAQNQLRTARQGMRQDVRAARQGARPAVQQARQALRGMRRGAGSMGR